MTEALEKGSSGTGGAYVVGDSKLWRFRPNQLPEGWYHENGDRFPEGTDEYEVLDSFTPEFKADNGITLSVIGGINILSLPTAYHTDSRGMFRRPGTPVGRQVPDTMLPITGTTSGPAGAGGGTALFGTATGALSQSSGSDLETFAGGGNTQNRRVLTLNSGNLSPNHNGTETAGLHVLLTPAIYLGTPR